MQELHELLGVAGARFNCCFHEDGNPSASILFNKESGHYIYKCHSSNCNFNKGTIIKCVERILGCTKVEALHFLMELYMVEYEESDWQKQQKALIEENIRYLFSNDFQFEYPELFQRVRTYLPELFVINTLARNYIISEEYSFGDQALFFASSRYIAKLCGKRNNYFRVSQRINLFAYLGLVKKLSPIEIPDSLLQRSKEYKKQDNHYVINYFSIPSYCDAVLTEGVRKAIEFKESGFTIAGFSREMLLGVMDKDKVDAIYPQMRNRKIPQLNQSVSEHLEKTVLQLIHLKGWTTETEIVKTMEMNNIGSQQLKIQLKRVLPELMVKYCLRKQKLNNLLKQQFNITDKGYFNVILSEYNHYFRSDICASTLP
jgi:hypothetical protein